MPNESRSLPIPTHMRAAVLWETGKPLRVEDDIEIPPLLVGQILVKLAHSGVCHSQLMETRGKRGEDRFLPHLLGHEGTGQVVAVGEGVSKVKAGDWVVLGWIRGKGMDVPGASYHLKGQTINSGSVTTFSNYTIAAENRAVPLPKGVPKDIGVLFGCALPTGAGMVLNEVKPQPGSSVAIVGLGGIGLSALMACQLFDCDPLIVVDVSSQKLDLAQKFGATHTVNAATQNIVAAVRKITNGDGVDYSIEAAGRTDTIERAFEMVRREGGQCLFASHPEAGGKICLDPFELISGKSIRGSWGGATDPDQDIPKLAELYLEGSLPLELLLDKEYSLDEINDALDDLEQQRALRPLLSFD